MDADAIPAPVDLRPDASGGKVLVVDDQRNMRATTAILLRQAGHAVQEAEDGASAIQRLQHEAFDVVLTDLRMPTVDGMEVLKTAQQLAPDTQVIVMTAYGTIESAVDAIRHGAYDFLAKPFKEDELLLRVAKALEKRRLVGEVSLFAEEFRKRYGLEHIIGRSPAMREVLDRVLRIAPTDATVLITGESGVGKELVARALHVTSRRGDKPFVPVNCAAITETLLESELFGHAKGAFTGATRARRGMFEEANAGTLFIDEIGETAPGFQAKLLRALQEGEIRRVGESTPVQVNVRVIAATNQDLRRAIVEKRFREDLFYRLNVVPIRIPPLRERRDDIPLLAGHFLRRFNQRTGGEKVLTPDAAARLVEHDWPGNVRELENMIEQAAALSPGREIRASAVEIEHRRPAAAAPEEATQVATLAAAVEDAERRAITAALTRCGGDLGRVARELGVSGTTLWRKMKRLAIEGRGAAPLE
ncbi:sigma-54-dependent transcriptional regulator [Anaeromyxobacter oryzae]|uniref:Acetoacetate metabolism regulatory protein AtoC n=1 Tax=Anaeromyxobacter oryzae TaxID=2918170 RepID=A0ABM7WU66_9BACT|nr:sigma-54 dependent transcriptional regulator [Anaeromyxobacter oryzae]BDG03041.1 acetoacetate metabolism regulatory protein AtoC [Anaeromyxobacter oryzae]